MVSRLMEPEVLSYNFVVLTKDIGVIRCLPIDGDQKLN